MSLHFHKVTLKRIIRKNPERVNYNLIIFKKIKTEYTRESLSGRFCHNNMDYTKHVFAFVASISLFVIIVTKRSND